MNREIDQIADAGDNNPLNRAFSQGAYIKLFQRDNGTKYAKLVVGIQEYFFEDENPDGTLRYTGWGTNLMMGGRE